MPEVVPRGRYAPSPTGRLHLGNARTALVAWLSVRAAGGRFIWRVEDLDTGRNVSGMEEAALQDMAWLGIDWDEGPDVGGPHAPYRQSERTGNYESALRHLLDAGRIFPCRLSRKDLRDLASAPHTESTSPYPASLRPKSLSSAWYEDLRVRGDASVRFMVHDEPVHFHDRLGGMHEEVVSRSVGDFVLRRRDDVYAYQLAVVVDDLAMKITEVVRGRDLLSSTARQIQLIEALSGHVPAYAHVPLLLNPDGEKLSKRDAGLTVHALREAGVRPEAVVGYFAWTLGLRPSLGPVTPVELTADFAWDRMSREDRAIERDLVTRLGRLF